MFFLQVSNLKYFEMQIKDRIKPALPHLIAVLIFIVVSFVYFYPVLEGKVLKANDSTVSKINSKEIQDFRDKNRTGTIMDKFDFQRDACLSYFHQISGKSHEICRHLPQVYSRCLFQSCFFQWLVFIFFFLFSVSKPWLAIAGALAYGLTSFFFQVLGAGHNTQAIALAYMPPFIGGIYYAYKRDAFKGALFNCFFSCSRDSGKSSTDYILCT